MKTLKKITVVSISIVGLFTTQNIFSQTKKSNIEQDEKIERLLNEKRKSNSAITINDKFKIQIYFGTIEESKKTLLAFKKDFSQTDGTITFSNPSYKVWVGSYKSKIEAEKALIGIKKKYPTAVIIEPNKK
ncbi:SPOR domain-containing protein [Flavobacterium difficile]|uniref:SPOR domain-containing protein n=1 Tax=Flavobacterium difficile TaxID=2709659 RepID=UPI001A9C9F72|nr:SPOR domain-containing protein [Flavobacterium difficile]